MGISSELRDALIILDRHMHRKGIEDSAALIELDEYMEEWRKLIDTAWCRVNDPGEDDD